MKQIAAAILLTVSTASFAADTYTQGYFRRDGHYVQPHYSTAPNNTNRDNYSTQGNTNPYHGRQGTVTPDLNAFQAPPAPSYNYGSPPPRRSGYQ